MLKVLNVRPNVGHKDIATADQVLQVKQQRKSLLVRDAAKRVVWVCAPCVTPPGSAQRPRTSVSRHRGRPIDGGAGGGIWCSYRRRSGPGQVR